MFSMPPARVDDGGGLCGHPKNESFRPSNPLKIHALHFKTESIFAVRVSRLRTFYRRAPIRLGAMSYLTRPIIDQVARAFRER